MANLNEFPSSHAVIAILLLACVGIAASAQQPKPADQARRLQKGIEVYGGVNPHGYKSDSNNLIQFGAPAIGLMTGGSFAISRARTTMFAFDLGGVNEKVTTTNLPSGVLNQASLRGISIAATSLRIQVPWRVGVDVYLVKGLHFGYLADVHSWRYEKLNNVSYTTIPYIRAIEDAQLFTGGYALEWRRLTLSAMGGIGSASTAFRNGTEEYLGDVDMSNILTVTGRAIPASGEIGFLFLPRDSSVNTQIFAKYDSEQTSASGFGMRDNSISIGASIKFNPSAH